jgi:hypothetical protein
MVFAKQRLRLRPERARHNMFKFASVHFGFEWNSVIISSEQMCSVSKLVWQTLHYTIIFSRPTFSKKVVA